MRPLLSGFGIAAALGAAGAPVGCAGSYEAAVRRGLAGAERPYPPASAATGNQETRKILEPSQAGLSGYVRAALKLNPSIRASFQRWRAGVYRISVARRLPEPQLSFGYFVRSVQTRVGPQRARLSLQQAFPWPAQLTAGADAASAKARALQRRFEAQALAVAERVAAAYWNLWQLRTTRAIHGEHLGVIRGLSESVRARMSTGAATLADLQQTDLAAARIEDNIRGMDEAERGAEAMLRAAIGVPPDQPVPTPDEPGSAVLPSETPKALADSLRAHPQLASLGLLAEASQATARAQGAKRFPSLTLGAEWIVTGPAYQPGVEASGRDAVAVGAGMSLPLWQSHYADAAKAAEAESRAHLADRQSLLDRAEAEVTSTLASLRDATRRIELYRVTLVPQAETAYESVLGSYTVGRGTVAQALLAQRDLLELRIELERARAQHARTWARLEQLVGHAVAPASASADPPGEGGR